ncbi:MAG: excisionase family DNA-binding protein [Gloeotrichia echinulata IR180]
MTVNYVPPRVAATRLGVSTKTLERWLEDGKIEGIFTQGGQRRYNLDSVMLVGVPTMLLGFTTIAPRQNGQPVGQPRWQRRWNGAIIVGIRLLQSGCKD